jgi:glycosyltransferase involved in cell wall biosynthesis
MTRSSPGVSVVLTTFRRARELPATINSILRQTYPDFELILSDDASPDDTEAVCREYERADRRVRYRRNPTNLNMPGNLNAGIREAVAPLIANLHDGDVYRADLLERWKGALDESQDAAFVFNACEAVDSGGKLLATYSHDFPKRLERGAFVSYMMGRFTGSHNDVTRVVGPDGFNSPLGKGQRFKRWLSGPFDSPVWGTVMARQRCYQDANGFDPHFGFISDVDMWLRLNEESPAVYIREPLISLAPRGNDRPHSDMNWKVEVALADIFLKCAERTRWAPPGGRAALLRDIRSARSRRWLFLIATALKRGQWNRAREGLAILTGHAGNGD